MRDYWIIWVRWRRLYSSGKQPGSLNPASPHPSLQRVSWHLQFNLSKLNVKPWIDIATLAFDLP